MAFSAWKIWWHPKFTARIMDEYEKEGEAWRTEAYGKNLKVEELLSLLDSERAANRRLKTQVEELERELSLRKDAETQIREFDGLLTRVEEMKARYEERIAKLRAALEKMKSAPPESTGRTVGAKVIDMGEELTADPVPEPKPVAPPPPPPADDGWLEDLPE